MNHEVKIKVSGFTGHNPKFFPEGFHQKLINSIGEAKQSEGWNEYINKADIALGWMAGRRYHDNERVAHVILGEMQSAVALSLNVDRFNTETHPLIEMRCLAYASNLDQETLNEWIYKALEYSGECDHWYTYEKEWD